MQDTQQVETPELGELATLMFTDVAEAPECGRCAALESELREEQERLVRRLVGSHGGRVVKRVEEGFLLEFSEPGAAVACGLALQEALAERNARESALRQLHLRVGIHVGRVVRVEGEVYGEGVNLAARLEALAPAGSLYVSEAVVERLRERPARAVRLGRGELRGIRLPVGVYRVDVAGVRPRRSLLGRLGWLLPRARLVG